MRKLDLSISKEENAPGSRISKKVQKENAERVLERAKLIPRKVIFLKQGAGEYAQSIQKNDETMFTASEAAEYLGISYHYFSRKIKLPFVKKTGNRKMYRLSVLDKYKNQKNVQ